MDKNLEIAYCVCCGKAMIAPLKEEDTNGIVVKGRLNVLCQECAVYFAQKIAGDPSECQGDSEE